MELRLYHWLSALLIAGLLHAAIALWFASTPQPTAIDIGIGGFEIDLGSVGGIVGVQTPVTAPEIEPTEQTTEVKPVDTVAEITPVVDADAAVAAVEPIAEPETPLVEVPELASIVPDVTTPEIPIEDTEASEPEIETVKARDVTPVPKPKPKKKPKKAKAKPKPKPKPQPQATVVTTTPAPVTQQAPVRAAPRTITQPSGQTRRGTGAQQNRSRSAGASPAAKRNYYSKLAAWLNRHKRYPRRAQQRRQEGIVKVNFTIDRQGRVLSHRIVTSSGHRLLDKEVAAMLRRASPLPAIPADLGQAQLSITVPISFALR